jgi:RNA polymerase sigma-70 factor, ECF subfamily
MKQRRRWIWRTSRTRRARLVRVDEMTSDRGSGGGEFAKLLESHRSKLKQIARRLCRDEQAAEDLVQETMEKAWVHQSRFVPGTDLGAWLGRILTRLFLDICKHQNVVRRAEPDVVALGIFEGDMPFEWASDDELRTAIESLEPELRDLVNRCHLQRQRYCDVAAALNLPSGTIATRLKRARKRLREILTGTKRNAGKP